MEKSFAYVAVIGQKKYLEAKSLKMVYTESRELALNLIAQSLCDADSRFVIISDTLFNVDINSKLSKKNIRVTFFGSPNSVCEHIKLI